MPSLLIHGLFAATMQSLLNVALLGQGINELSFYAAIVSVLVDLDHDASGRRSSVHSIFTMILSLLVGAIAWGILFDTWFGLLTLTMVVGVESHLALDITDGDGIHVMPSWFGDPQEQKRASLVGHRGFPPLLIAAISGSILLVLALM